MMFILCTLEYVQDKWNETKTKAWQKPFTPIHVYLHHIKGLKCATEEVNHKLICAKAALCKNK